MGYPPSQRSISNEIEIGTCIGDPHLFKISSGMFDMILGEGAHEIITVIISLPISKVNNHSYSTS